MARYLILFLCVEAVLRSVCGAPVLHSAAEIHTALLQGDVSLGREFQLEATAADKLRFPKGANLCTLYVTDKSGAISLVTTPVDGLRPGDVVRVSGTINGSILEYVCAFVKTLEIVSLTIPPPPAIATCRDINSGRLHDQRVTLTGMMTDMFRDEVDPRFVYAVLADHTGTAFVPFQISDTNQLAQSLQLIGQIVTATGICAYHHCVGRRKYVGMELIVDHPTGIVLTEQPSDPYNVPSLHTTTHQVNPVLAGDFSRRKLTGKVLVRWKGNRLLVKTPRGDVSALHLLHDKLPAVGESIEAVGIPDTDLYHLNLTHAIWRQTSDIPLTNQPPELVSARNLLTDGNGHLEIKTKYIGSTIRMVGKVSEQPEIEGSKKRISLLAEDLIVPVDLSEIASLPAFLEANSTIEVTGVCVADSDPWRPQFPFPRIGSLTIVPRTATDIRLIASPPWWTPIRLLAVIATLLLVLAAILIWNRILSAVIIRRSRQLFREQIARTESELKTAERTRLAIELHDSLSQNLTAVALEINAACHTPNADPERSRQHLFIAEKALKSCRNELTNCLWDLRGNTLEEHDVGKAIQQAIASQVGTATLSVNFDLKRQKLSDQTAHAILCIVRELATNAVRHGQATNVSVSGHGEADMICFSVADNGCGFDPKHHLGMAQGHFGLMGVEERVKKLNGTLEIESSTTNGTKVTITLRPPCGTFNL